MYLRYCFYDVRAFKLKICMLSTGVRVFLASAAEANPQPYGFPSHLCCLWQALMPACHEWHRNVSTLGLPAHICTYYTYRVG